MLKKLGKAVRTKQLDRLDRWGVHNDLAALCFANEVSLKQYISFVTSAYTEEDEFLTLMDIFSTMSIIRTLTADKPVFASLRERATQLYNKILSRVGWERQAGEKETRGLIRSSVILGLGKFDDESVLHRTAELFEHPESLDPDMKRVAYRLAAWQGNAATYDGLLERYREAERKMRTPGQQIAPTESCNILMALADFRDPVLAERTLEWALTNEVRPQNLTFVTGIASLNPQGRHRVWPWIKKHWGVIKPYAQEYTSHFTDILSGLSSLADTSISGEIEEHLKKDPIPGTEREVRNLKEMMQVHQRFVESV